MQQRFTYLNIVQNTEMPKNIEIDINKKKIYFN